MRVGTCSASSDNPAALVKLPARRLQLHLQGSRIQNRIHSLSQSQPTKHPQLGDHKNPKTTLQTPNPSHPSALSCVHLQLHETQILILEITKSRNRRFNWAHSALAFHTFCNPTSPPKTPLQPRRNDVVENSIPQPW